MPNYLGKLRSFLIIYYRVYAKKLIAKVYAKDVKELIIYYYYYSRSIGRANLRFSGFLERPAEPICDSLDYLLIISIIFLGYFKINFLII